MDRNLQRQSDSEKHSSVSLDRDLSELVKSLVNDRALEELPARKYRHFCRFERNPSKNVEASSIYKWIKNVKIGRVKEKANEMIMEYCLNSNFQVHEIMGSRLNYNIHLSTCRYLEQLQVL